MTALQRALHRKGVYIFYRYFLSCLGSFIIIFPLALFIYVRAVKLSVIQGKWFNTDHPGFGFINFRSFPCISILDLLHIIIIDNTYNMYKWAWSEHSFLLKDSCGTLSQLVNSYVSL